MLSVINQGKRAAIYGNELYEPAEIVPQIS